jgi:hypothetical protein
MKEDSKVGELSHRSAHNLQLRGREWGGDKGAWGCVAYNCCVDLCCCSQKSSMGEMISVGEDEVGRQTVK